AVFRLYSDSGGRIWFGGFGGGGLSCYDGERLITYTMADGLADDKVKSIVEDNAGNLWVGTFAGLCRFDGKQFITYATAEGLSSLQHQCSAKDINGHLWFGTLGGGLYRYNGKHFQQLTTKDGLLSNSVTGLLPQPDGSMIIGTYRGIVHYRPTAMVPPGIEIRGVTADRVYPNPTALQLNTTGADLLTIAYHGLSLATRQMRYSYLLEGHDDDWRDTWENSVSYDNLPVGEYTFKVIAINRDLVESEAAATLKLTIVPDPRDRQIAELESEIEKRNRELEAELRDAHDVQMALMPKKAPKTKGIEIIGRCVPAKTVSGDFYDYISLQGDRLAIVLADVTGKGMKGAMNAVLSSGALHAEAKFGVSPAQMLGVLNENLYHRFQYRTNCAMGIATIDPIERKLQYANAGLPYPLVKRNGRVEELKSGGMPLGGYRKAKYADIHLELQEGDVLVFCSDGITESPSQNNPEMLYMETDRLSSLIVRFDEKVTPQQMMDIIFADVREFSGDAGESDDMTVVVVKVQ
ncbi:SpoIIE family protein phosphatase, partial [Candidatus Poribacteria bacterium]|nr:SpoIIE family protein phosphatase [Candidatus Poribacteria bacterium]